MKKALVLVSLFLIAGAAFAQNAPDIAPGNNTHSMSVRGFAKPGGGGAQDLLYHSPAPVIRNAKVVLIFWGPSFGNGGAQAAYANELQQFRNQFGTSGEYNTITEYYDTTGNIAQSNLAGGTADMFDTSAPPVSVSDAAVQGEVLKYLQTHSFDNSTVYEVFIPPGSYSNDGGTSCGGPNLQYCAYHGHFSNGGRDIKYSIEPYPNCSGCSVSGWTAAQNQEHFVCHETREAVTDPDLNAWFDRRGYEADDKCAWTPSPFIGSGGFGYQYEWSNAANGCIKTK